MSENLHILMLKLKPTIIIRGSSEANWDPDRPHKKDHHYIKPCFTVLRIDFFHFNSSAGSFYKDEKVATTAEFEIVSSEIPWKKILKLALSLFLADLVDGNPTTKWRKRFFSTGRVWAKLFETVLNPKQNSSSKSKNYNLDLGVCMGKV